MLKQTPLTSIVAVLAVFGAGTLQVAIAIATIQDLGVRVAFSVAIVAAIIMDALVIHSIGTTPSNKLQKGLALTMLVFLFIGLALDIVLLLTQASFENETFGWLRAGVGINIAVSLVLAAGFFAASDTNTHERQMRKLENNSEMQQAKAFHDSPEARALYAAKAKAKFLDNAANELGIPVSQLTQHLGMSSITSKPNGETKPFPHPELEAETNGNKQRLPFP